MHNYQPNNINDDLTSLEKAIYDIWGYDFIAEIYNIYIYPSYSMETAINTSNWAFSEEYIPQAHLDDIHSKNNKDYPATLKENTEILSEYITFCAEHNLKLFFLMTPYSNYYKKTWNNDYVKELWETLSEVGKDYDYTVLDFSDEEWADYYFGDYAHLNKIGAIRFSTMLDQVIHAELNM